MPSFRVSLQTYRYVYLLQFYISRWPCVTLCYRNVGSPRVFPLKSALQPAFGLTHLISSIAIISIKLPAIFLDREMFGRTLGRGWLSFTEKYAVPRIHWICRFRSTVADPGFVVSILGPPNAGKSTLFNRLQCRERNKTYRLGSSSKRVNGRISSKATSRGNAIVSPIANTTRDRRQCWGRIGSTEFQLNDTAGVDGDRIHLLGQSQTLLAAEQAHLNLLVFDGKLGVSHDLVATARWLRKVVKDSQVAIVANKLEGDSWAYEGSDVMQTLDEVARLGFGEAITVSALQVSWIQCQSSSLCALN